MEVSTVSLWQQQEENPEGFEVASRKTKVSESRLFLPAASLHNYRDGVRKTQELQQTSSFSELFLDLVWYLSSDDENPVSLLGE